VIFSALAIYFHLLLVGDKIFKKFICIRAWCKLWII